jgi:hypothetical protein
MAIRNPEVMKFKVGDLVRVSPKGLQNVKDAARLTAKVTKDVGGDIYTIEFDTLVLNDQGDIGSLTWYADAGEYEINPVKKVKPTLADTINLAPGTRRILGHLEKRGSISPVEAQVSYGDMRLAARIFELREVGYDIKTTMKRDEGGHNYARYSLAA